jgi:hypothetical protein
MSRSSPVIWGLDSWTSLHEQPDENGVVTIFNFDQLRSEFEAAR